LEKFEIKFSISGFFRKNLEIFISNFCNSSSQPLSPNLFNPIQKPIFQTELSGLVVMESGNGCHCMVLIAIGMTLGWAVVILRGTTK